MRTPAAGLRGEWIVARGVRARTRGGIKMPFRNGFATLALMPALLVSASLTACSSDDNNNSVSSYTPFDSGSVTVPEAGSAPTPITVQLQGQGGVYSADVHPADGGLSGALICTAASTPAQCTAPLRTTIYAIAAEGWVFSRWTTPGLDGGDLGHGASSYTVGTSSPNPVIAVFVPEAIPIGAATPDAGEPPAADSGPPPEDAGGNG
jgi:hypothetical protein